MKRVFKTLTLIAVLAFCVNFSLFTGKAEAEVSVDIPVLVVDEVDNYPYPDKTPINYGYDWKSSSKFTLGTAGQLRAFLYCQADTDLTGSVWISKDSNGRNVVGEITKITGDLTDVSWFLHSGTYYLNTKMDYPVTKVLKDGVYYINTNPDTKTPNMNIALMFEDSRIEGADSITSFRDSIFMNYKDTKSGFLTNANPAEYYSFNLTKKATVTVKYSFDTSTAANEAVGYCGLYDVNELLLKEGTYTKANRGSQEYTYLLEAGTYYVKLNGILGNTTLSIAPMYYDISLTRAASKQWTKKHIDINIDTSIDYSDIIVLYKDVKYSLLDNNVLWSKTSEDYVALDGETFIARKSGTYSVRITDKYGYNTMQKIKISNIDVNAPKVKGVADSKSYQKAVIPTWTDKQSGINKSKTTLNGKLINSGTRISKEGKYTLKVYDKIGNYKTIEFCIDHTAPTANIENGRTYQDSVALKFKDDVSGIKKVVVDGKEVSAVNFTMYYYLDGEYTVELWDNADNYRKYKFTIKKE